MTPVEFAAKYYKYAVQSEKETGVPALLTLAQAALESGWGKHAPGNMFFGIKAGKSWQGKKQLLRTTEILSKPDVKFPEVISVTPLDSGKYKYVVKDWFRAYDSPKDSFSDHGKFLRENKRYAEAFLYKDPKQFATEVAKAGYATAPDYASILHKLIDSFSVVEIADKTVKTAKRHWGKILIGAAAISFAIWGITRLVSK